MLRLTLYYLFTLYFFEIFCAKERADRLPVISIPSQGDIKGVEISKNRVHKIVAYYGIPYAQAPLGQLRFAPPMTDPLPTWEGVRNLTNYMPSCLQNPEDFRDEDLPFFKLIANTTDMELSEDCLFLNVFVPMGNVPAGGFATIIWLHPGHFTTGSPVFWNPHTLVYRQRVIIVTVAFRINIFGFLTTMDGEAPGNFGLMDQQAAMAWVKNNIEKFSGNPNNICLMGYGTGGTSIGIHMTNQESKPLFHKAIIMSGNVFSTTELKKPIEEKEYLDNIAHNFGCIRTPTSQLIDCLRRAEGKDLIEFTSNTNWKPVIDAGLSNKSTGFIPDSPSVYFARDEFHQIPVLTGYTHMEKVLGIKGIKEIKNMSESASSDYLENLFKDVISTEVIFPNVSETCASNNSEYITDAIMFFYGSTSPTASSKETRQIIADFTTEKNYAASTFLLASYTGKFQPTFMYRFDMKPVTAAALVDIPDWVTVPHLFDLLYVWGVPYWTSLDETQWAYPDKRIADTIMSLWTNFAKSSDPTVGSIYPITWEPFKPDKPGLLRIINGTFLMSDSNNFNYKTFEFWNDYYPKVVKIASQCCSFVDSGANTFFTHSVIFLFIPFYITL